MVGIHGLSVEAGRVVPKGIHKPMVRINGPEHGGKMLIPGRKETIPGRGAGGQECQNMARAKAQSLDPQWKDLQKACKKGKNKEKKTHGHTMTRGNSLKMTPGGQGREKIPRHPTWGKAKQPQRHPQDPSRPPRSLRLQTLKKRPVHGLELQMVLGPLDSLRKELVLLLRRKKSTISTTRRGAFNLDQRRVVPALSRLPRTRRSPCQGFFGVNWEKLSCCDS
mmetsp:Transcript_40414/g.66770  ORF Transcript_40414/g.66770 Transcript_40414/m.66770 type:complete len:222 (+) Transcript_40414:259-924(+)